MARATDDYIQYQTKLENLKAGGAKEVAALLDRAHTLIIKELKKGPDKPTRIHLTKKMEEINKIMDDVMGTVILPKLKRDGLALTENALEFNQEALAHQVTGATKAERMAKATLAEKDFIKVWRGSNVVEKESGVWFAAEKKYAEQFLPVGRVISKSGKISTTGRAVTASEWKVLGELVKESDALTSAEQYTPAGQKIRQKVGVWLHKNKYNYNDLEATRAKYLTGVKQGSLEQYYLPKAGTVDFSKDVSLRKAFAAWQLKNGKAGAGNTVSKVLASVFDSKTLQPKYDFEDDIINFLNSQKKGWKATRFFELSDGGAPVVSFRTNGRGVAKSQYSEFTNDAPSIAPPAAKANAAVNPGASVINTIQQSPAAIFQAANAKPLQGKLMAEWATQLKRKEVKAISDVLTQSWAAGESTGRAIPKLEAVFARAKADLATITRTFYQHMASETQRAVWKANEELIEAIQWDATLDNRTTVEICAPRDQLKYTLKGEPIDHSYPWLGGPGQAHWNCRSTGIPTIKGMKPGVERRAVGGGKEYERGDNKTRTGKVRKNSLGAKEKGIYKDQLIKPGTKYEDWLKRQPAAFQDDVLGKARGAAFRDGTYKLGEKFQAVNPKTMDQFIGPPVPKIKSIKPPTLPVKPPPAVAPVKPLPKKAATVKSKIPKVAKPPKEAGPVKFNDDNTGTWNKSSLKDAPRPLQKAIQDHTSNIVVSNSEDRNAYYRPAGLFSDKGNVVMGAKHNIKNTGGQAVYRHEIGHALDNKIATKKTLKGFDGSASGASLKSDAPIDKLPSVAYRSSQKDYKRAIYADEQLLINSQPPLISAGGSARNLPPAYIEASSRISEASLESRVSILRQMADDAGIDYDVLDSLARTQETSLLYNAEGPAVTLLSQRHMAKAITAVKLNDPEMFYRHFVGEPGGVQSSTAFYRGDAGHFSDLIGSTTRNKVMNHSDGYPGHSTAIYDKWGGAAPTETFANLTALYGGPYNKQWTTITKKFLPNLTAKYEEIIGL
jgi:hypothetical protein